MTITLIAVVMTKNYDKNNNSNRRHYHRNHTETNGGSNKQ